MGSLTVTRVWRFFRAPAYMVYCQVAVIVGFFLGIVLRIFSTFTAVDEEYFSFPGEILAQMLKLVTMPLMVTEVVKRVGHTKVNISKKSAVCVAVYFVVTTLLAVITGLTLVRYIEPGVSFPGGEDEHEPLFTGFAFINVIINMAPDKFISVYMEQPKKVYGLELHSMNTTFSDIPDEIKNGFNTPSLVIVTGVYGWSLYELEAAQTFSLVSDLHEVFKNWEKQVVRCLPLGLMLLAMSHVLEEGDWDHILQLGKFVGVVVISLIIHGVIMQPLVYAILARNNPFAVIRGVYPTLLKALDTASSSSTMPVTSNYLEDVMMLNQGVTQSMLPIVTAVGKDGTILYQVVSVIFVAQLSDIRLNLFQLVQLCVNAIVLCIRTPGSQEFGAFTTLCILSAVHLPSRDATLLVLVEWLLDKLNTMVNVLSQCYSISLAHQLETSKEKRN